MVLGFCTGTASAVDSDGLLVDFLIDSSEGHFSRGESSAFITLLNQFQLDGYSLRFSDGTPIPLSLTTENLEAALASKEEANADLVAITGPSGSLSFATSADADSTCSTGALIDLASFNDILGCVGTQLQAASPLSAAVTTVSQVNTIDLLILRPTTQFMTSVRGFVENRSRVKWSGFASESRARGGGAGDQDPMLGPWGSYFNGGGSFGNLDTTAQNTGFNVNNQFATGGVDYRFSDAVVTGFLFNFTGSQVRYAADAGVVNADIYRFMPFVSVTPFENAYIDILAGYSYHAYNTSRFGSGTTAAANYSADQALASISLGYSHPIGALELTGFAGGGYVGTDVGGYQESGQGLLVSVGGYHVSSWTSNLGLQADYSHGTSFGVLRPHLRLEWVHEFDNQGHAVNVIIPSLSNLALPVVAGQRVSDWGNLTAGLQAVFAHGFTGFANYQAQIFSAGENHVVEGGIRVEF